LPELRRDPIVGRWTIISTERGKRPSDFIREEETNTASSCPFCPGFEDKTPPEILAYHPPLREKDKSGWWVRVVPNKFPALQIEGSLNRTGEGMYDKMNGIGAHEVVIETPDHAGDTPRIEDKRVEDIFWACRDRIVDLKRDPRIEYILIFKNKGYAAGASLQHPHSQLIATPMVPIRVKQEILGAKNYFDYKERCVFCDIIRQELNQRLRVIIENEDFVALTPFASRFPFETWVLPKRHDSDFEDIQKNEMANLARTMKSVLAKMNIVLDNPPYNYLIHNAPLKEHRLPHYHWHIEIMPKLTRVAGFEWGTDFYINPTPPEEAAKYLREAE
jgi:UDPglucose--hexose-1-phosphate uridylyltransferase